MQDTSVEILEKMAQLQLDNVRRASSAQFVVTGPEQVVAIADPCNHLHEPPGAAAVHTDLSLRTAHL